MRTQEGRAEPWRAQPRQAHPRPAQLRRAAHIAGVSGVLLLLAGLALGGALSAAAAPSDTIITVTVVPAPSGDGAGGGSGSGSGGSSGGGSTNPSDSPQPSPSSTAGSGSASNGILFVSGLSTHYVWSPNPLGTAVRVGFTVRNGSSTTFDSTARFWIDGPFSNRLAESAPIAVSRLKPGTSRHIETTLSGLGQWTGYHVWGTLTPPKSVDGIALKTISRDAFIALPPLLAGGFGLCGVAIYVTIRFVLYRRPLAIAGGAA